MAKLEFVYWKPVKKSLLENCEFEQGVCNNEQIELESIVSLKIQIQITDRKMYAKQCKFSHSITLT